jgi:hypothetical protein
MMRRWSQLHRAAKEQASREVRETGCCVLGWVPEPQARGVWHLHVIAGARDKRERNWCNTYARYVRKHASRYGFGHVGHIGKWGRGPVGEYVSKLAEYLSKGSEAMARAYQKGDIGLRAWYVSRRCTGATGQTSERVRRRGLYYRRSRRWVADAKLQLWSEYEQHFGRQLRAIELRDLAIPLRT